jgi:hypothetical protein
MQGGFKRIRRRDLENAKEQKGFVIGTSIAVIFVGIGDKP